MNINKQIKLAFDAKYSEIGADAWHDIALDKVFEFGWQACLTSTPYRATDLAKNLRQMVKTEPMQSLHAKAMTDAADEIERYFCGMMAWKQTAETKDRKLSEELTKRVDERVAKRLSEQAQQPASKDWKEDFEHENGMYQNKCTLCDSVFLGHKRRVVCKVCAEEPASPVRGLSKPAEQPAQDPTVTRDQIFNIYCDDKNAGDWHRPQENYEAGYRKGFSDAQPSHAEFQEGQWWLKELDALVANGTPDQKRAVYGVVRNLMRVANAQSATSEVKEHCKIGDKCNCWGDVPQVRRSCFNWSKA